MIRKINNIVDLLFSISCLPDSRTVCNVCMYCVNQEVPVCTVYPTDIELENHLNQLILPCNITVQSFSRVHCKCDKKKTKML